MSSRVEIARIARRYALAGFSWAEEHKKLADMEKDLSVLEAVINEVPEFKSILETPLMSREEHRKAMAVFCKTAKNSDVMQRVIGIVAENRRLDCLQYIVVELRRLLSEHKGIVTVDVVSATELSTSQVKNITEVLKKALGQSIELKITKDEYLIGGLIVKAGSLMIDSSIKTQLEKMMRMLKNSDVTIEKETMKEVA